MRIKLPWPFYTGAGGGECCVLVKDDVEDRRKKNHHKKRKMWKNMVKQAGIKGVYYYGETSWNKTWGTLLLSLQNFTQKNFFIMKKFFCVRFCNDYPFFTGEIHIFVY